MDDWRTSELKAKAKAALEAVLDGKPGRNAAVRVRLALMVLAEKTPEARDWAAETLDDSEVAAAEAAAKGAK